VDVHLSVFNVVASGGKDTVAVAVTGHPIATRRQAEQRLRTLIESGPALSHSLDYAQTLKNLADLVVRALATFCEVDVFARAAVVEPRITRVVARHVDRSRQAEVDGLAPFVATLGHAAHPVARVFEDGASSLVESVDDTWLERATVGEGHAEALRALGVSSLLCVPLVASGRTLGALTCYVAHEERAGSARPGRYDAEDLFFLEELGRRAGIAIENALSFAHERLIAASLQAASLPEVLPSTPGVTLSAYYRPGSAEATIGGDWYDAIRLEDGNFVFTIGDVVGNGLRAGIAMTKLRQAMQAAAMVDSDPNVMLAVADRTLRLHDPDGFATSLAARYDLETRELTLASAGHPGPLLRLSDGRIDDLTHSGLLLGMRLGTSSETNVVPVPSGALLVFYTDGLVEATRDMAQGQQRLLEALSKPEIAASADPARDVVRDVLRGALAGDDIAVLIVAFDHGALANSR
jgi:hypothetical protein